MKRDRFPQVAQLIALTLILTAFNPNAAPAAGTGFDWGISVATDPFGYGRTLSLNAGESALLYVLGDDITPALDEGLRSIQFGVHVDPRLEILQRTPTDDAYFALNREPDEWLLGFADCVFDEGSPYVLMIYEVRLPTGTLDTENLVVDVGSLNSTGEVLAYTTCWEEDRQQPLRYAGRAVLNPTAPQIFNFLGSETVVVEGRSARLVWEAYGAAAVSLNGELVDPIGELTVSPTSDTTYTLESTGPGSTDAAEWSIEVIRRPRVELFAVEPFMNNGELRASIEWEVTGANTIRLTGTNELLHPRGFWIVDLLDPPIWALTASNEWGLTEEVRALEPAEDLPPIVISFTAGPTPFYRGQEVQLDYRLYNATSATIEPDIGSVDPVSGTIRLFPTLSTTYTLTASNQNGTASALAWIKLAIPRIEQFTSTPSGVWPGESATLEWAVGPGLDVAISPDVGPVSGATGSVTVTPVAPETIYVLTASHPEASRQAERRVNWRRPRIEFAATNLKPFPGDTIELSLAIEGADEAALSPGFGNIDPTGGSFDVTVDTEPIPFVVSASNAGGVSTQEIRVVPQRPTVALGASNQTPWTDETIVLTMEIDGALSATLEPGIGEVDPNGGTVELIVTHDTEFTLTATNAVGSTTASLSIDPVLPEPPVVHYFRASSSEVAFHRAVTFSWWVAGAESISIEPGGFITNDQIGEWSTVPEPGTHSYTLTATNSYTSVARELVVSRVPYRVLSFAVDPTYIVAGESAQLSWEVQGTAQVSLIGFGPQGQTASVEVSPDADITYQLRVRQEDWEETLPISLAVLAPGESRMVLSSDHVSYRPRPTIPNPGDVFPMYVLLLNPAGDIRGYQLGIEFEEMCMVVTNRITYPLATPDTGAGLDNWIVQTEGCTGIQPLLRYEIMSLSQGCAATKMRLVPASPSSFSPPSTGYLGCDMQWVACGAGPPVQFAGVPPVTAVMFDLQFREVATGLELNWSLWGKEEVDTIRLLRAEGEGLPRELVTLTGAQADREGSFVDTEAAPGARYRYRILADSEGVGYASEELEALRTSVNGVSLHRSRLLENVPNPFNPQTEIRFQLLHDDHPRLEIFDSAGRSVRSVQLGLHTAGAVHEWTWDGNDDRGLGVSSGVYHVRLVSVDGVTARSVALVR